MTVMWVSAQNLESAKPLIEAWRAAATMRKNSRPGTVLMALHRKAHRFLASIPPTIIREKHTKGSVALVWVDRSALRSYASPEPGDGDGSGVLFPLIAGLDEAITPVLAVARHDDRNLYALGPFGAPSADVQIPGQWVAL